MKKALLRIFGFILLLAAVFWGSYFGSGIIENYIHDKQTEKLKEEAFNAYDDCIGFSKADEYDAASLTAVKLSVIESYQADFAACNPQILYSKLDSDMERLVYNAFEYAWDNSFNYIFFDKNIFGDDVDFKKVLFAYVLDSPVAEQNISYGISGKPDAYISAEYVYENSKGLGAAVKPKGYLVSVSTFCERNHEKYAAAYDKACSVVANMPDGLTDMEKARYLYKYLCVNTAYKEYEEDLKTEQLYDALILGETQCDGFSNAFSLLCNLAGVPCCEKMHIAREGEDAGHTWNCFFADGVWYNADATYDSSLEAGSALELGLEGFGFSDKYQRNAPEYTDLMPECTGDTLYADRSYLPKDTDPYEMLGAVIQSWRDSGMTIGCVITDVMTAEEFSVLKEKMQVDERIPEVDTYYFYNVKYPDCEALVFINSTNY